MSKILDAALAYHDEGLNVIPVVYKDKKPALPSWEVYHTRRSTKDELTGWFGNGKMYNIGIVHGKFDNGLYYAALDIDHDNGILEMIKQSFWGLASGRVEQSGSGEGYHIPLWVEERPDFGDKSNGASRGNKTWKTPKGDVNIRLEGCQTVAPPSIHPTGNPYRFIKEGDITFVYSLEALMFFLDKLIPQSEQRIPQGKTRAIQISDGDDLLSAVKEYWSNCLMVFAHFGLTTSVQEERNGELRLAGNGGLLITRDHERWYCFDGEIGGSVFEAWGYCRFGTGYDKHQHFRQVLIEMAQAAGIDVAKFYCRGDESKVPLVASSDRWFWTNGKYNAVWGKLR